MKENRYSQVGSDFSSVIVQESRGLVLDAKNDFSVVAFPYKKFFNLEESLAARIEWSTAVVYLSLLYFLLIVI